MKFLVDAQLPRRLCDWLLAHGHDAIHTLDLLQKNKTPDGEVSDIADAGDRAVITKDADFVHSHLLQCKPRKILVVRTGNMRNADLLNLFDTHQQAILEGFLQADFLEMTERFVVVHLPSPSL